MAEEGHPQSRAMEYEDVEEEVQELLKRLSIAALLFEPIKGREAGTLMYQILV